MGRRGALVRGLTLAATLACAGCAVYAGDPYYPGYGYNNTVSNPYDYGYGVPVAPAYVYPPVVGSFGLFLDGGWHDHGHGGGYGGGGRWHGGGGGWHGGRH